MTVSETLDETSPGPSPSRDRTLPDDGQQRHEPVPPSDLAPVPPPEPRVHGPPGPGTGDMSGGGPAVLHGAEAPVGNGREEIPPEDGLPVQKVTGLGDLGMTPTIGMTAEDVPPVHPTPHVVHDNGEVITKANGSGLSGGRNGGARDSHPGREEEDPPHPPAGTGGTGRAMTARGARDLQHDLLNAPRAVTLRARPPPAPRALPHTPPA